ncbi:MAG: HipA domain-containing protein, partial [Proteobacteria bacterium]|nr:HipA domain-containing protein [Pseudomonadota bacterium]
ARLRFAMQISNRAGCVTTQHLTAFRDAVAAWAAARSGQIKCLEVEPVHAMAVQLDRFCADVDIAIGINVVTADGNPFTGNRIRALAEKCGLRASVVQKHQFQDRRACLLVRRFDREPLGGAHHGRIPYISARAVLRGYGRETEGVAFADYSYVVLADALRRVGRTDTLAPDLREIFKRMAFNILIDNTDDHERNHGLLYDGGWSLAPAFDVSSQVTGLGYQAMSVGAGNTTASLANALSECGRFGLGREEAGSVVQDLVRTTEQLEQVYLDAGVDADRAAQAARIRQGIVSAFRNSPHAD